MKIRVLNRILLKYTNNKTLINNTLWLFVDKILRAGGTFILNAWMAKEIGVSEFGIWSYAIAFISIFAVFANLGMKEIVVRDLVESENKTHVLSIAITLRFFASIFASLFSIVAIFYIRLGDSTTFVLVAILSTTFIIQTTEIFDFYFQSELKSKYTVLAKNIPFLLFAFIKMYLIVKAYNLNYFALITVLESFVSGILLFYFYIKSKKRFLSNFENIEIIKLLKSSFPLMLSGLAVIFYMRIDQIMLRQLVGDAETGKFSVAVILSEMLYTIPTIVSISALPILIKLKQKSKILYENKIEEFCTYLSLISVLMIVFILFSSKWIISIFFGNDYLDSAPILMIHSISCIFVFQGFIVSNWLIIENLQRYSLYRYSIGAFVNIFLNFLFIPKWGAIGSAYATVISQFFATYLSNCFTKSTLPIFLIQSKAYLDIFTIKFILKYFNSKPNGI